WHYEVRSGITTGLEHDGSRWHGRVVWQGDNERGGASKLKQDRVPTIRVRHSRGHQMAVQVEYLNGYSGHGIARRKAGNLAPDPRVIFERVAALYPGCGNDERITHLILEGIELLVRDDDLCRVGTKNGIIVAVSSVSSSYAFEAMVEV